MAQVCSADLDVFNATAFLWTFGMFQTATFELLLFFCLLGERIRQFVTGFCCTIKVQQELASVGVRTYACWCFWLDID
jgi:hypothetical protein